MYLTRGTARIVPSFEPQIERVIVEPTTHDEYLLGVVVALPAEYSCVGARPEPCQSRVLTRRRIYAQSDFLDHALEPGHRCPPPLVR